MAPLLRAAPARGRIKSEALHSAVTRAGGACLSESERRTLLTTAEKGRIGVGLLLPVWVQVSRFAFISHDDPPA